MDHLKLLSDKKYSRFPVCGTIFRAILILQRSEKFPAICVLITTKSSQTLREALHSFAEKFFKDYSQYFTEPIDQAKFETASDLVLEAFPFLPEYD